MLYEQRYRSASNMRRHCLMSMKTLQDKIDAAFELIIAVEQRCFHIFLR